MKQRGEPEAEFALLVGDAFQSKGLGTEILRRLMQIARDEKLSRVTAQILSENLAMQRVCREARILPSTLCGGRPGESSRRAVNLG